jgi:hypothetical protein
MPHSIHAKTFTSRRARPLAVAAATLLSVAPVLAGCGGSSTPGVAHISSTTSAGAAGAASGGSSSEGSPEQATIAFAKCMRSNGVPNFPDPNPGGGGFRLPAGANPEAPAFKAAQAKCHKLLPGGGPPGPGTTTNPSPQTLARFLKVARCMRRNGVYDFPDPRTSVPSNPFGSGRRGGVISDIEGVILIFPSTIEQQRPAFTRAAAACVFPLHNH